MFDNFYRKQACELLKKWKDVLDLNEKIIAFNAELIKHNEILIETLKRKEALNDNS